MSGEPTYPDLRPEPGEVATILGRARSRRRRSAGVVAGSLSLVLVATVGWRAYSRPPAAARLQIVDDRGRDVRAPEAADGASPAPGPTAGPGTRPGPGGAGGRSDLDGSAPGRGSAAAPPGPAAPAGGGPASPAGPARRPYAETDYLSQGRRAQYTTGCDDGVPVEPAAVPHGRWCVDAAVVLMPGELPVLHVSVCWVLESTAANRLTWSGWQEVELTVKRGGQVVWVWSRGQTPAGGPHSSEEVDPGDCLDWSVRWDATDSYGDPVPAGDYLLVGEPLATEVRGQTGEVGFTLTR